MAMMVPMRRSRNLLSELMSDPFDAFFDMASAPAQKMSPTLMRTDIKETDAGFELTIDLPASKRTMCRPNSRTLPHYRRADAERDRGQGREGHLRPQGALQREVQPHVLRGDDIEEDDIRAKFEDGVLRIAVPKKQEQPKLEEKKTISIEG